jgi:hypothetical protein
LKVAEAEGTDYLWLLPTVRADQQSGEVRLYGEGRILEIGGFRDAAYAFLSLLDGNLTRAELDSNPLAPLVLPALHNAGFLVRLRNPISTWIQQSWKTRQLSYFSHLTRDYPDAALEEIGRRSVLIIGAGGIGSHAAFALAAAGIGRLYVTDPDSVDESNLNRQFLYDSSDCGLLKIDALRRAMLDRFHGTKLVVEAIDFDVDVARAVPPGDLLLLCAEAHDLYRRPERIDGRCVIQGGYLGSTAVVGPSCGGRNAVQSWAEFMAVGRESLTGEFHSGELHGNSWNASSHSINAVAGGVLAEAAIRELCPTLGRPLLRGERWTCNMRTLECSFEKTK